MSISTHSPSYGSRLTGRGYQPVYHHNEINHCPGCGGTHWHIGRTTAECARCETALPLAMVAAQPERPLFKVRVSRTAFAA